MIRDFIPGAIYSDLRTTGERVALVPQRHIETHLGILPFPPGEPWGVLFLRQTSVGPWKVAGKGHESGDTWEWDGGWKPRGPSNGENGFIYDLAGNLHIIAPGPNVTSQGYRYVAADGSLVLGDATYGPWNGLSEWSDLGDGLYIGQGDPQHGTPTGAVLWDASRGVHLLLEAGLCTFIRSQRVGEAVAITFTTPAGCAFIQTTMTELRALPVCGPVSAPPAEPPAPPVDPVPPVESPRMTLDPNILAIRDRYVAAFPVPQARGADDFDPATGGASASFEERARVWTRGLAEQIVFETGDATIGVKNAGGGRPQSKDSIAINGPRLINFDMLSGVGTGHPTVIASPQGADITGQVFMPVSPVNHLGDAPALPPSTPPASQPPAADLSSVLARLALVEAANSALRDALAEETAARVALADAVEQLEGRSAKVGDPISVAGSVKVPFYGSLRIVSRGALGAEL